MSDGNDWIDWHGGDCPVASETVVNVQLRGSDYSDGWYSQIPAGLWAWNHSDEVGDIIKYRIVGVAA